MRLMLRSALMPSSRGGYRPIRRPRTGRPECAESESPGPSRFVWHGFNTDTVSTAAGMRLALSPKHCDTVPIQCGFARQAILTARNRQLFGRETEERIRQRPQDLGANHDDTERPQRSIVQSGRLPPPFGRLCREHNVCIRCLDGPFLKVPLLSLLKQGSLSRQP